MKAAIHLSLIAAGLLTVPIQAQNPADTIIQPVEIAVESTTQAPATPPAAAPEGGAVVGAALGEAAGAVAGEPVAIEPTNPDNPNNAGGVAPADNTPLPVADNTAADPAKPADEGFIIKDAGLNDIFQFLAKSAGRQYFHNSKIAGPEYLVTGHLNDGNPIQQMEELAFMYSLTLHHKGNTIYALTQAQLSQLPSAEFQYQLRYLRPSDAEAIKDLIRPVLSPGTGIVNFEPKTNTIIIIDSANRIEAAQKLLHGIDKAKGQIIVETKILRVNSSAAERVGVNWSSTLGDGTSLSLRRSLNSVFGIDNLREEDAANAAGIFSDANVVLSPLQLDGVLRALSEGNLASQVSNPTLITEDNERATISIVDRIPIITTTSTQATSGGNPTVTEEVRYKIDQGDKTIDADPENHREIGISLVVTPTLLPDGTIRMKMRPRNAQVTGSIKGIPDAQGNSNEYPQVSESMIETIARIPDGNSLLVGGFYGEVESDAKNKVPLLGDVPVINFFFKSKEASKENSSLVFIVTPTSYDPASKLATDKAGKIIRTNTTLRKDHNWVDPYNPGPAHEPNLKRTIRGLQPHQAPYYPRPDVVAPPSGP